MNLNTVKWAQWDKTQSTELVRRRNSRLETWHQPTDWSIE